MLIMVDLRRDTFEKIQLLSFSYFDKTSSGWLIARMQNDTSSIGDTLSWGIIQMVWGVLDIVFTLITMFTMDWRLSLIVAASLPIVIIIVPIFEKAVLKRHRTARNAYSHYVGWLAESIDGAKTIKTLAIEDKVVDEADEITTDVMKKRFRAGRVNAFFQPAISLISTMMVALVIFIGLIAKTDPKWPISIALIVVFTNFIRQIYNPIQEIAETFSEFMATQAGAEKVMQLLEAEPAIQDKKEVVDKYGDLLHPKEENYEKARKLYQTFLADQPSLLPWCPKCGSENVTARQKSSARQLPRFLAALLMFVPLGICNTEKFVCNDCGHKWER